MSGLRLRGSRPASYFALSAEAPRSGVTTSPAKRYCMWSRGLPGARIAHLAPHDLRRELREAVSPRRRRTGADSVSARACLGPDDRAVPRLQTETAERGERGIDLAES